MRPAATAPEVLMAPPWAGTLLTVSIGFDVSNSHSSLPSAAETAYSLPSDAPSNTTPGIAVGAAPSWAPRPPPAGGGGVNNHTRSPVVARTAARPAAPRP